ncbi:hypothetical protein NKR23_g7645 [Pleurostoma richardsiae]|uniref:Uncharacterized protein n=1 Tax=Pleurostoma richardsiae TaxID=41990 RepID=A0AA38R9X2_9PEZI|nr:hypothetical protein NKR23_g7645 [Pleurostoma richardsiae]
MAAEMSQPSSYIPPPPPPTQSAHAPLPTAPFPQPTPVQPSAGPLPTPQGGLFGRGGRGGRGHRGGRRTAGWLTRTCLWMLFFLVALPLFFRGLRHVLHAVSRDHSQKAQSDLLFDALGTRAVPPHGPLARRGIDELRGLDVASTIRTKTKMKTPTAAMQIPTMAGRALGIQSVPRPHPRPQEAYCLDYWHAVDSKHRVVAGSLMMLAALLLSAVLFALMARRFGRWGGNGGQEDGLE